MKNSVQQIFNYIQGLNPASSSISSIGTFVSAQNQQVAEREVNEIASILVNADKKETLAFKILTSSTRFSEKQLWVIAFELEKNEDFTNKVIRFYAEIEAKSKSKQAASKAKLTANKEASSDVLASIKSSGKKLGDYYVWLKKSSFKKEFFSKKYSTQSAQEFINL